MKRNILSFAMIFAASICFAKGNKVYNTFKMNSGDVKEYRLKNGIPVYINDSVPNKVCSVFIIVEGGTMIQKVEYSGLESSLFEMMTMGSKNFSYNDIQLIKYENQSSISHYSMYSGSVLTLNCINYYLDQMMPIMLDGFLNPAFNQAEYDLMMNNYYQDIQFKENDPESILFDAIHKTVYKDHPFLTTSSVNKDSIKNITIENLKLHHKEILSPSRIRVVAVGNINIEKFIKQLNGSLGKLKGKRTFSVSKRVSNVESSLKPLNINSQKFVLKNKNAKGAELICRVFASPSVLSEDYIAARITEDIFTSLTFNIIREKYGACYSVGTKIISSPDAYGFDYGLQVSDMENFPKYLKETQELLKSGKIISSIDNNSVIYDTLENSLPGYINSYLTRKYSSQSTSNGIASRITSSILQFGDITSAEKIPELAKKVTKDDVLRVFNKYWLSENCQWFEMRGE